jgi:hypothetical protein
MVRVFHFCGIELHAKSREGDVKGVPGPISRVPQLYLSGMSGSMSRMYDILDCKLKYQLEISARQR